MSVFGQGLSLAEPFCRIPRLRQFVDTDLQEDASFSFQREVHVNQSQRAVHRMILVADVEGFGDSRRVGPDQIAVREGMYGAFEQALHDAGVSWQACEKEDRGDGLFALIPADTEKGLLAESFPLWLADAVRAHNAAHKPEERFRLRMALHAGEIRFDDHGATGAALNLTFRLVDAAPVKSALRHSSGVLAVVASSWFYSEVIRNSKECRPDTYRPVLVSEKETSTTGWVALPDHSGPSGKSEGPETWRVRILDSDGGVHGAGVLVHGRYVITAATAVAQSLNVPPVPYRPHSRVLFDLPGQPQMRVRPAEIVWWPSGAASDRSALAGLSVVGPAIHGVRHPPLRRAGLPGPRVVRSHRFPAAKDGAGEVKAWGRLRAYNATMGHRISLDPLSPESGPNITREHCGADVVDAETGAVLGIVAAAPASSGGGTAEMVSIRLITDQWRLLNRIVAAAERDPQEATRYVQATGLSQWSRRNGSGRAHWLGHADFLRLIEHSLQAPELATAQSRHTIASELPLEVALTAPRSTVDRADIAALLWACADTRGHLDKLRRGVRRKARNGSGCEELLKDLDKLCCPDSQAG